MRRFAIFLIAVGCSSPDPPADADTGVVEDKPPVARFLVPGSLAELDGDKWFDHPWPSDLRIENGFVRLDGWPDPRNSPLLKRYRAQLKGKLAGFSPAAAGYFSFEGSLDEASFPKDEKASLDPASTIQLVDTTSGARHPIVWKWRQPVGDYYLTTNTLSWAPAHGHPLKPKTRYAIVVTRDAKGPKGNAAPNAELQSLLDGKGPLAATWGPAIDKSGVPRAKIAHLSVFTTQDPVGELIAIAEDARAQAAPKVKEIKLEADKSTAELDRYEGIYQGSPDYQQGTPPFLSEGGDFVFKDGKPVKQRDFELRFKLVVPNATKCPMPAAGYPIVLYAHGTTGSWTSFINEGTADALVAKCIASMGVDQIFHGTRPGAPALDDPNRDSKISLLFFNLENALAARTNGRQSAVDEVARAYLVRSGGLDISADLSATKAAIKFDPARLAFMGHSQGGLNGPLFMAVDDSSRGGVLSGAGSAIAYSLLLKVKPDPSIAGLVKAFLGVTAENADELGPLHPAMSLIQMVVDPTDPLHYYPALAKSPFAGRKPKSILMTEGVASDGSGDNYAPPRTIEAGAVAGGFPLVNPVVLDIPELTKLDGIAPVSPPIKGNAAMGKVTVGIAQFTPMGSDGHFVMQDVPRARAMTTLFIQSVLNDEVPSITNP
jgi:hypothetical protein